jgi:hypothetical protein
VVARFRTCHTLAQAHLSDHREQRRRENQLLEKSLTARVVSVERGIVRARLDGRLRMRHDFYFKPDGNIVDATLLGDLEIDGDTRVIRRFRLVTPRATYGGGRFGVVIRSEPAAKCTSP